ncbi:MAG: ribosome assembly cofactor RimP [Treponema sp.]|jgi:ribosome maturation factor RimP|nr:ribosome assembly cofactor RimP [Treponema sp.]
MRYTPAEERDGLYSSLEPVAGGLGLSLVETTVSRKGGNAQIRLVVYRKAETGAGGGKRGGYVGIDDCSAFHRAVVPLLDRAFPGTDYSLEVSSPGINRRIRDGAEFAHYTGERVRCYRTDISDWSEGTLESSDEAGITLAGKDGSLRLAYEVIAKAVLNRGEV